MKQLAALGLFLMVGCGQTSPDPVYVGVTKDARAITTGFGGTDVTEIKTETGVWYIRGIRHVKIGEEAYVQGRWFWVGNQGYPLHRSP